METLHERADALLHLGLWDGILLALGIAALWTAFRASASWARLRHVPGPPLASVSYIWGLQAMHSGRIYDTIQAEQKKYGRVMRIGPDAVCVYEPEALWRINAARSEYTRGSWYSALRFDPRGDSVLSECDTARHDQRKAKLAAGMKGYSGKGLLDLETAIDASIRALTQHVRARIARGAGVMDMGRLLQFFQIDLITKAGFGKAWGDLADETDHYDYLKDGDETVAFLNTIAMSPMTRAIFNSLFFLKYFGPKRTDRRGFGQHLGVLETVVLDRFQEKDESNGRRNDMLDEWIKQGLKAEECQLDLALQMPAGTETSISTIRGVLLLLVTSPAVYARAKREIVAAAEAGRISRPITNAEAKTLPYMEALLLEGLRMMPPITLGFPKRVPAGGDTLCGVPLPAGTDVYQNFGAMLRNPAVFGPDADVFRPERLLPEGGSHPDTIAHMRKTIDLNFGYGRFGCLGKVLAQIEMNKIFVELLRSFDFQLTNPEKPWSKKSYSGFMINDFNMRVTEAMLE